MSNLTERLRLNAGNGFVSPQVCALLDEAAAALETLEWFAEYAYSMKDRERAREALGFPSSCDKCGKRHPWILSKIDDGSWLCTPCFNKHERAA